ncbi:membrane protein [Mycolicibacter heraklionensis]|uniref:LGFP repeat-containing protein n=2 Tax=Mycolicibacter heraklionensis TaxID=512402 RepID=A0A9X7WMM4_9MYCO|nr:membrane protein [Mycolicibacter heraklionensis]QZA10139.1 LGFP repeat-containing protein [Mycolicibacter heraklionensis]
MALGLAATVTVLLSVQTAAATPDSDAHDAITAAWQAAGGDGSPLGAPKGDVHPAGVGFAQDFAGGTVFFTPETGAKALYGAILDKYEALGGAADNGLGFPSSDEVPGLVPGSRVAILSGADNPVIFWTPEHGAHVVRGPINAGWDKLGSSTGALGVPVEDESYDGAVVTQKFSAGTLSFDSATRTFTTVPPELAAQLADLQAQVDPTAAIDQTWRTAGGPAGALGAKQGGQYAIGDNGGAGQDFAHGKVYFSPVTGANAVEGDVLAKYESLGGPAGSDLGFPITSTADGAIAGSKFNSFAADDEPVIFFSPDNGAFVVRSAMKAAWDKLDGASGKLGAPVGDQTVDGDVVSQKFTGGSIAWNQATNTFSTEPADLAQSLSGLQIPGTNLPDGSKATSTGVAKETHWNWLWVLIPVVVLAVLGALAGAAMWWQRRRPAAVLPGAPVAVPAPVADDYDDDDEQWAHHDRREDHREHEGTVRLPSRYGASPYASEPELPVSSIPDAPWLHYGEHESEPEADDDDDADTAPTRVVTEEDFGTGRHAVGHGGAGPDPRGFGSVAEPRRFGGGADTRTFGGSADTRTFGMDESVHPVMHLPLDDPYQQPTGYPIKANIGSGLYYTPQNALYDDTLAEIWFATEDAARLNGFTRAG